MKLIQISDLHGNTRFLQAIAKEISEADLVVLSGDLTNFEGRHKATEIVESLQQLNTSVLAVPGNCDHKGVGELLTEMEISLDRTCKEHTGFSLCGVGGSLPCPGKTPNEYSEEEFAGALNHLKDRVSNSPLTQIYVIHQPPAGTLVDRISSGAHVGSHAVRAFLEETDGILCLTGHIHESAAIDRIGGTTIANPGPARHGRYASIEIEGAAVHAELKQKD